MAGNEFKVIFTLIDNMSAKLAGMDTKFVKFGQTIDNVGKTVAKLGAAFAAVLLVNQLKGFIEASLKFGESIADNARRMGVTVEQYQKLDYIGKQFGTTGEGLERGFRALTAKFEDHAQVLKKLGVQTRDTNGNYRDMNDIFFDTIGKLQGIGNATERTQVTQNLFAKQSGEMMAIVSAGAGEIDKARERMLRYGLILSGDTVKKLQDAQKEFQTFDLKMTVFSAQFISEWGPSIVKYIDQWLRGLDHLAHMSIPVISWIWGKAAPENLGLPSGFKDQLSEMQMEAAKLQNQLNKARLLDANATGTLADMFLPSEDVLQKRINAIYAKIAKFKADNSDMLSRKSDDSGDASGKNKGILDGDPLAKQREALEKEAEKGLNTAELVYGKKADWEIAKAAFLQEQEDKRAEFAAAGADMTKLYEEQWYERENFRKEHEKKIAEEQVAADKSVLETRQALQKKLDELTIRDSKKKGWDAQRIAESDAALDEYNNTMAKIKANTKKQTDAGEMNAKDDPLAIQAAQNTLSAELDNARLAQFQRHKDEMVQVGLEMANQIGNAMGGMFTGKKDAVKQGLKQILDTLVDFGIKTVEVNQGIATANEIGKLGFLGIVTALAEVALLETVGAGIKAAAASFTFGGIVGGNSYAGDRIPARVNSGEMILNQGQQQNLWRMAQGTTNNNSSVNHYHFYNASGNLVKEFEHEVRRGGDMDRVMRVALTKYGAL